MGLPVIIVPSGGLPVSISTNGYGLPVTLSTNGYGVPITQAVAGYGLPVVGVSFGPTIDLSAFRCRRRRRSTRRSAPCR